MHYSLQTPQTSPVVLSATNPYLPSSASKVSMTPTPIRNLFAPSSPSPPPSPPPPSFLPLQTFTPALPSPPQLSERLRKLLEQRAPSLRVHLVPVRQQQQEQQQRAKQQHQQLIQGQILAEKQPWYLDVEALTVRSAAWPESPPRTGFEAWVSQWDPRIVVLLSVIGVMLVITGGAWMLGSMWAGR